MPDVAFKYFHDSYAESMQTMFAAVSDLYARYWGDFFHFAIFGNEQETWEEALARTHQRYAADLQVSQAERILEIACGRGGFADYLARHTTGDVLGIDISPTQLAAARRFRRPNLRFKQHDVMAIGELGQTFNAISFLDAACYVPDKALAVSRIKQAMAPGARLLLVEWCKKEGLSSVQEELVLHPFMKSWAVPNLETVRRYEKFFKRNGYRIIHIEDLNDQVAPNWERGYREGLKGIVELSAKDLPRYLWKGMRLGRRAIELVKDQFTAALYIKCGFDAGFLRYVYFLVENEKA